MNIEEINNNEAFTVSRDSNWKIQIIDEKENAYSIDEWKSLETKPTAVFIKYIDDELDGENGNDNAILIYAGSKENWPDLSQIRWANTPSLFFTGKEDFPTFVLNDAICVGKKFDGYENCKMMISLAINSKIDEYNNGEKISHLWKDHYKDESPFSNNIENLPDKMESWKDYLPGIASISDLKVKINGMTAIAYVPAIGQLEKIEDHLDTINEALKLVGGDLIIAPCVYWSSNESNFTGNEMFYLIESKKSIKSPYHTIKSAKRTILPLFKIPLFEVIK